MAINLTIVKSPAGISVQPQSRSFGTSGGHIGRGADNDWVLSDPERFLSSRHCQISQEAGRYYLTDLSTNGTFINGSPEPVGRGSRVALADGDNVDVGEYRFKVSVETVAEALPSSPFGDTGPLAAVDTPFSSSPEFGDYPAAPESMYMSSDYGGLMGDITPDAMKIMDPLEALGGLEATPRPPRTPAPLVGHQGLSAGDFLSSGSQEDSANLLSESAAWPDAHAEASLLPEDWDADLSLLRPSKAAPPPPEVFPPVKPTPPLPKARGRSLPSDDSLIVNKPDVTPPPDSVPPEPLAPVPPPPPKPTPVGPSGGLQSTPGTLDRTLVDALGLGDIPLSDEQIRDIHVRAGTMLRESLDGLMQILRSRASIKNEFRMNVTTIQPQENNPIKFSANVDEMIELMFVRRSKAYKDPVVAVQESCQTIADHQVAVIAGIRSAFRSSMARFDPQILEEEFKQSGKAGVLSGLSKGKYWSAYQDHYQQIVNNMEQSFRELFGDEFSQAYEDQLRKLSSARKDK